MNDYRCPVCLSELLDRWNQDEAQEDHDVANPSCGGTVEYFD